MAVTPTLNLVSLIKL